MTFLRKKIKQQVEVSFKALKELEESYSWCQEEQQFNSLAISYVEGRCV
jgi:hypothetical protein